MENIVIGINVFFTALLIIFILLQRSEGGALGLGVSQDNFTSARSTANFLTKMTAVIATLFIVSSIILVIISRGELSETQSVLDQNTSDELNLPQIPETNK